MFVLAVMNLKGGVGKTTLAVNLADIATQTRGPALVVDLDPQNSAMDWARGANARIRVEKVDRNFSKAKLDKLADKELLAILDCPPRYGDQCLAAAVAADVVLVPVTPGQVDLWATNQTLGVLEEADALRAKLKRPELRRFFVPNRVFPNTLLSKSLVAELKATGCMTKVQVRHRVAYPEAIAAGTPLTDKAARDEITKLLDEVWKR